MTTEKPFKRKKIDITVKRIHRSRAELVDDAHILGNKTFNKKLNKQTNSPLVYNEAQIYAMEISDMESQHP